MLFDYVLNFFRNHEERSKSAEIKRIRQLEAQVQALQRTLTFYAGPDGYPQYRLAGQKSLILDDGGRSARHALETAKVAYVAPVKTNVFLDEEGWSVYKDSNGVEQLDRRKERAK